MFKVVESHEMLMKAQVVDFTRRCMEVTGSVDVGEIRAGISGSGLDEFVVGFILGSRNFDVVGDEGRLFFRRPTECGGGCLDFPLRISGFAHHHDLKRRELVEPPRMSVQEP